MHAPVKPFEPPQNINPDAAETRSLHRVFAVAVAADLALFALLLTWVRVA